MKTCPHCAGHCYDLRDDNWEPFPCPVCRGVGQVPGLSPAFVSTACHVARALLQAGLVGALLALVGAPTRPACSSARAT